MARRLPLMPCSDYPDVAVQGCPMFFDERALQELETLWEAQAEITADRIHETIHFKPELISIKDGGTPK